MTSKQRKTLAGLPKPMRAAAAEAMPKPMTPASMTPGQIIGNAKAQGKKVPGMNWEDRMTPKPAAPGLRERVAANYRGTTKPMQGPGSFPGAIGSSIQGAVEAGAYGAGKFVRGSQKVGDAMGKVIPAIGKAAAVGVLGNKVVSAARKPLGLKMKIKQKKYSK